MTTFIRPVFVIFILLSLITGVFYPLAVTAIAQTLLHHQANGSLIENNGKQIGSALIGQPFDDAKYFWSRPSATGPMPYNASASSGSNLGPTNPALHAAVQERIAKLKAADPDNLSPVPVDLVTASASGLDPHISPAAAEYQVKRVANVRHLNPDQVRELIARHTEARTFGLLGEPRVNVLLLNQALDQAAGR